MQPLDLPLPAGRPFPGTALVINSPMAVIITSAVQVTVNAPAVVLAGGGIAVARG